MMAMYTTGITSYDGHVYYRYLIFIMMVDTIDSLL